MNNQFKISVLYIFLISTDKVEEFWNSRCFLVDCENDVHKSRRREATFSNVTRNTTNNK